MEGKDHVLTDLVLSPQTCLEIVSTSHPKYPVFVRSGPER